MPRTAGAERLRTRRQVIDDEAGDRPADAEPQAHFLERAMKAPEDEGPSKSRGAEERLRQHLQSRLPADEVEEVLRQLHPRNETDNMPAEESPASDGGHDQAGSET